ncbi:MAG: helix-turn-helix domain-containing protein [Christensenellaceae bacterium]|jgi:transcriptional regulator with XRE-family HTH domain|nr:helix-turn-helix domain-containing protein [Christensenellaceae bacterium]
MMQLNDAIKRLRTEYGISHEDFGNIIGVAKTTISNYEAGTKEPSQESLLKLANYFDITLDYVIGNSDFKGPYPKIENEDPALPFKHQLYKIPILANKTIPVSQPIFAENNYDGYIYSQYNPEDHFAVRIRGNWLMDVGVMENTILIVKKQKHATSLQIVIGLYKDELLVRQYLHNNDYVHYLIPRNFREIYEPVVWHSNSEYLMLGRAVDAITRLI